MRVWLSAYLDADHHPNPGTSDRHLRAARPLPCIPTSAPPPPSLLSHNFLICCAHIISLIATNKTYRIFSLLIKAACAEEIKAVSFGMRQTNSCGATLPVRSAWLGRCRCHARQSHRRGATFDSCVFFSVLVGYSKSVGNPGRNRCRHFILRY